MNRLFRLLGLFLLSASAAFAAPGSLYHHEQLRVAGGIRAQTGGSCGTGVAHCTTLNWTASTTAGVTYNVFRGTVSGGESATPINAITITGTSYIDPITLTNQQQTFFYYVEAVEVSSGFGTLSSAPSNETSATFPAIPASPTGAAATPH